MHDKTVLIAGAGIAGPTLAYWLGEAGFEPTIIERAPKLRTGGYVTDFRLGYDVAERMGLAAEINRIGYHMRELRVVDGRGERLAGLSARVFDQLTHGRGETLGRSELSRLLLEKSRNTAEVIFGDEIVGLQDQPAGVRVQFRRRPERRFDLVIGADGFHSDVRRMAFGPQDRFENHLGYMAAAIEVHGHSPRDPDIYMTYCQPGRMLGRFSLHDDRTVFLFVFADDAPIPATLALQKAMLRERYRGSPWECARILDQLDLAGDLYFDRVSQIRMDTWSRGRVALIGDAAFCVSSAAGRGAALAMISAYVLAGELAKGQRTHGVAFRSYESILRPYIRIRQKGAERVVSTLAPKTPAGLWFRNQVIKAFSMPGMAGFAASRNIADTFHLPDYRWPSRPRRRPDGKIMWRLGATLREQAPSAVPDPRH